LGYDVTYLRKLEWGERRPSEAFRVRLAQVWGWPLNGLPASSPAAGPGFPVPGTPLIGRDHDAARIVALLGTGVRLVTILGAPGIGKTRLSVEVASRIDDERPGRVQFVALLDIADAGLVGAAIAEALGLRPLDGAASLDGLVDRLGGEETVLVLDNF